MFLGQFCQDQEVIQQGSGGYITKIRRLYKKDQEVMFSDAIIEPLQNLFAYKGSKITVPKKCVVFCEFCLISRFFCYRCYYLHRRQTFKVLFTTFTVLFMTFTVLFIRFTVSLSTITAVFTTFIVYLHHYGSYLRILGSYLSFF